MSRRAEWQQILDEQIEYWSSIPWDQFVQKLDDLYPYSLDRNSKQYQVEVEVLVRSEGFIQLGIAVDDGSLPWSLHPVAGSIVRHRPESNPAD